MFGERQIAARTIAFRDWTLNAIEHQIRTQVDTEGNENSEAQKQVLSFLDESRRTENLVFTLMNSFPSTFRARLEAATSDSLEQLIYLRGQAQAEILPTLRGKTDRQKWAYMAMLTVSRFREEIGITKWSDGTEQFAADEAVLYGPFLGQAQRVSEGTDLNDLSQGLSVSTVIIGGWIRSTQRRGLSGSDESI